MKLTLPGGGFFAPPVPTMPAAAPLPKATDPAVSDAQKQERQAAQRRQGIPQTIQTSGLGVTGDPNVVRRTLLGQ